MGEREGRPPVDVPAEKRDPKYDPAHQGEFETEIDPATGLVEKKKRYPEPDAWREQK